MFPMGLLDFDRNLFSVYEESDSSQFSLICHFSLLPPPFHLSFSYLTLQETPGIQDILCPWRKEEGGRGEAASGGGVQGRQSKRFHSARPQWEAPPTLSIHIYTLLSNTSWLTEGVELRVARRCGARGRGHKRNAPRHRCPTTIHPLSRVCPDSPFFPRREKENTPLHSSASFFCTWVSQFDFGIMWWDLIYRPAHLLRSVASCFGAGGCQDRNGT